jgi:hypothetical protein
MGCGGEWLCVGFCGMVCIVEDCWVCGGVMLCGEVVFGWIDYSSWGGDWCVGFCGGGEVG